MTEPHAGADPTLFITRAVRDGDEWVINGEKWFSSNARFASFFIVMAVTDPDVQRLPGHVDVHRAGRHARRRDRPQRRRRRRARRATAATATCATPTCASRPTTCSAARARPSSSPRPASAAAASTTPCAPSRRLRQAFDMMCERAVSRADPPRARWRRSQMTQEKIADSWIEIEQFRLLVLRTAWLIDKHQDYQRGPQGHRRGQGGDAEGATTTSCSGRCTCTARSASPTRCRSPAMMIGAEVMGDRRRAHRGPQDHRRPPGAQGATSRSTGCGRAATSRPAATRRARSSQERSNTSSATSRS